MAFGSGLNPRSVIRKRAAFGAGSIAEWLDINKA
jgi:hypothetical protein